MIKVVFVGDKPSSKNLSEDIPFVGAQCFKRLTEWIRKIDPDFYLVYNSEMNWQLDEIKLLKEEGFKVVALGKVASSKLSEKSIYHYILPHPSLKNRQNNDNEVIERHLSAIKDLVRT